MVVFSMAKRAIMHLLVAFISHAHCKNSSLVRRLNVFVRRKTKWGGVDRPCILQRLPYFLVRL